MVVCSFILLLPSEYKYMYKNSPVLTDLEQFTETELMMAMAKQKILNWEKNFNTVYMAACKMLHGDFLNWDGISKVCLLQTNA